MDKIVYGGSFDPFTNGHLWMVREAYRLGLANEIVIAIADHPNKKSCFSLDEKKSMIKRSTENIPNIKVECLEDKYLVKYADSILAGAILRGIRDYDDVGFESRLNRINRGLSKMISTIFLMPPADIANISSSTVKGLIGYKGWEEAIKSYVPRNVHNKLLSKFRGFESRWNSLWERIKAQGDPKVVYDRILEGYSEDHRFYHVMTHLADCFKAFDDYKYMLKDPDRVEFDLFMHDIIYDVFANGVRKKPDFTKLETYVHDNEERSAGFARDILQMAKVTKISPYKVYDDILYSKHQQTPEDEDTKFFLDADIINFGFSSTGYSICNGEVRQEFSTVPDKIFNEASSKIFKLFYERPGVYLTETFKTKYGEQAKENLEFMLRKMGHLI